MAAARMNSVLITRLSELSAAAHSPTKRAHQVVCFYQSWIITPISALSLTSRDECLQMGKERKRWSSWLTVRSKVVGECRVGEELILLRSAKEKSLMRCWQGLGRDGKTPSPLLPVLSRAPPIIAGLTVRRRAGLCMWAMGAVSFLSSTGPVDWFPWQDETPPSRTRKREWWHWYKISVSSNFSFNSEYKSQFRYSQSK